jgi:hypothetical protein
MNLNELVSELDTSIKNELNDDDDDEVRFPLNVIQKIIYDTWI